MIAESFEKGQTVTLEILNLKKRVENFVSASIVWVKVFEEEGN